jgi:photosystem II stability/assembly factor-like uncharacterized protein
MPRMTGRWVGSLLDAAGFEASLTLELRERRGVVKGQYEVLLETQHGGEPQVGSVEGKVSDGRVSLRLVPSEERYVEVGFEGDVFDCLGGAGLKGVYEVSPRTYSPLLGGVIAASTEDVARVDAVVKNDEELVR